MGLSIEAFHLGGSGESLGVLEERHGILANEDAEAHDGVLEGDLGVRRVSAVRPSAAAPPAREELCVSFA